MSFQKLVEQYFENNPSVDFKTVEIGDDFVVLSHLSSIDKIKLSLSPDNLIEIEYENEEYDENNQKETEKIVLSCHSFLSSSPTSSITNALEKLILLSLIPTESLTNGCDDENQWEYCYDEEDDTENMETSDINYSWSQEYQIKKRFEKKEIEIREEINKSLFNEADILGKSKKFDVESIFSAGASSKVLINDLLYLMKAKDTGYQVI